MVIFKPLSKLFLPDGETNLPASLHTLELEFESEMEKDGAKKTATNVFSDYSFMR